MGSGLSCEWIEFGSGFRVQGSGWRNAGHRKTVPYTLAYQPPSRKPRTVVRTALDEVETLV